MITVEGKQSLPRKVMIAAAAIMVVAAVCVGYGYFIEPQRLAVNRAEITVNGWNAAFDGLKIVAISDIHAGSNGADREQIRRVVSTANEQDADLIVLLGDYVSQVHDGGPALRMSLDDMAASLSGLRAKNGVYAVLGNHDDAFNGAAVAEVLRRVGYGVLNGSVTTIERNGAKLRLVGLRDHLNIGIWKSYSDENKQLLAPSEGTGDVLVLQHSPDIGPIITGEHQISADMKLMLSGHTHGGQVWLPVLGRPIVPSGYGQRYAAGYFPDAEVPVFVTTGVGTSILPFRFMVPPEIAVLTIRSGGH